MNVKGASTSNIHAKRKVTWAAAVLGWVLRVQVEEALDETVWTYT